MVKRCVHMIDQISKVIRFWVRAKYVAANCPTKMLADCCRGGAINRTCGYSDSYPYFLIVIIRVDSDVTRYVHMLYQISRVSRFG